MGTDINIKLIQKDEYGKYPRIWPSAHSDYHLPRYVNIFPALLNAERDHWHYVDGLADFMEYDFFGIQALTPDELEATVRQAEPHHFDPPDPSDDEVSFVQVLADARKLTRDPLVVIWFDN